MITGSHRARPSTAPALETEVPFEPMNHPGHLARRLHQICVAVFLDAAKDYNLTHIQFATLLAVERFPGIDQTRVAKLVALDRQTASNVITRLHQNGLIERTRKDKRTNALQITGAGRALIDVMQPRINGIDDIILGPLSASERDTLMVLLKKLVSSNNDLSRAPQAADWPQAGKERAPDGEAAPAKAPRTPARRAAKARA